MISSYKQVTVKYLKQNLKRTLLTIIGIILSVALISSIGLFFKGMQDMAIEGAKSTYGSFHLLYQKTDKNLINKIINNPKVSRSGLITYGNSIRISEDLVIKEMIAKDEALELLPYRIKEGRFSENNKEVAVEKWALRYIDKDAKIGDTISIKDKRYTLVGILEDIAETQISGEGTILIKDDNISEDESLLLVEIDLKTNLKKAVTELRQLGEENTVVENSYLLSLQGAGESSGAQGLYLTIAVIIGIVIISTIAVIYNSFHISVVERIKEFGLLRAIGATPRQIRKLVLREAMIIAIVGIPIGLLCGVIAIWAITFVFDLIGSESTNIVKLSISPYILGISALVGLFSIYISALLPAIFAGRISPLSAINSRNSIVKEKIKRRNTKIIGKILGIEGEIAAKNIKRNKKRYRITVFSILISVMLFVTFYSFMDMSLRISENLNESKNIHFSVIRDINGTKENITIDERVVEEIKSLDSVDEIYKGYDTYDFEAVIDRTSEIDEIQNFEGVYQNTEFEGKDKTLIESSVTVYDEKSLTASKKYLDSGNIDIESLNKEDGVILINKSRIYNYNTQNMYYGQIANIKVGDEIYLKYNDNKNDEVQSDEAKFYKVKVLALLKDEPFDFKGDHGLKIITTEELGKKLANLDAINPINLNIKIKDIEYEETAKEEIENILISNPSLKLINIIDENRNGKSIILMVKILLYGFVIVVSLISCVNIINTLTTNIILRKREFSILKAIGLTQRGLKKVIVLEGFMYGILGTIWGSLIGCVLSYTMFKGMFAFREFSWSVPYNAIAIAGICAIIIGYISVLSPLSRINKDNLIKSISQDY